ncbi:MAG: hypothetical protein H6618_06105 [Deltaproteobacteria bacterium]|nr:hypothetical protein [Deltaproteobacteria bacterium]
MQLLFTRAAQEGVWTPPLAFTNYLALKDQVSLPSTPKSFRETFDKKNPGHLWS